MRPDPPSFGECNGCEDDAPKGKTQCRQQDIKAEPAARLCDRDAIGGHAKPFQYDRRIRRVGDGTARAAGRQAFLKPAASQGRERLPDEGVGI